jgi:hypothetical protein
MSDQRIPEEAVIDLARSRWEAMREPHMPAFDDVELTPNGADSRAATLARARQDIEEAAPLIRKQATYEPVEEGGGEGHRIEIEFDGFSPSVKLIHPDSGCPAPTDYSVRSPQGGGCWLTDWLENEGAELLRGKLMLPVRVEEAPDRDHPLFHVLSSAHPQLSTEEGEEQPKWCRECGLKLMPNTPPSVHTGHIHKPIDAWIMDAAATVWAVAKTIADAQHLGDDSGLAALRPRLAVLGITERALEMHLRLSTTPEHPGGEEGG